MIVQAVPYPATAAIVLGNLSFVGGKAALPTDYSTVTIPLNDLTGGLAATPATGDLVIVVASAGSTVGFEGDLTLAMVTSGYTKQVELYSAGNAAENLAVFTKIMGGTPDTSFTYNSSGQEPFAGLCFAVHVWRGADQTTPMDVTATSATGLATGVANPPAITPVTEGALIVACGGTAMNATFCVNYTAPTDLTHFQTTHDNHSSGTACAVGIGAFETWSSGAFDPGTWTNSNNPGSADSSWGAVTLALRPA